MAFEQKSLRCAPRSPLMPDLYRPCTFPFMLPLRLFPLRHCLLSLSDEGALFGNLCETVLAPIINKEKCASRDGD